MKGRKKDTIRTNDAIVAKAVRVIGADGEQIGIMTVRDALDKAKESGQDLVEIAPQSDPPVCRIMNYGKFKFQQSKKLKEAKAKQKQIQVKEIKFKPRIDEHDYQFKLNHIRKFIDQGNKVRAFVHFRGREMAHREVGQRILDRILEELQDFAVPEKRPSMEGNQLSMILVGVDHTGKKTGKS